MNTPTQPLDDRGPLRVLFAITSMPVGGAETLLVNLCERMNRDRILPELCCLKEPGPLGDDLAAKMPVHSHLLRSKWDVRVLGRLRKLIRNRRIDGIVTVGAGDKMFWGRLAARLENLPVICSALHSTGWPDGVGRLNRWLTPITDAFIAVAKNHGQYLVEHEGFPKQKVHVIPNGVDTQRFQPSAEFRRETRARIGIPAPAPVVGIVAALRPEKNHELFLKAAAIVRDRLPDCRFLIIGDGPEKESLEQITHSLQLRGHVHFLGNQTDIPQWLVALDVFALTSRNEANPVSILEALSCGLPVVAPRVGSIHETVRDGETGFLVDAGNEHQIANRWIDLLNDRSLRMKFGVEGRTLVMENWSLDRMVKGYEELLLGIYASKVSDINGMETNTTDSAFAQAT